MTQDTKILWATFLYNVKYCISSAFTEMMPVCTSMSINAQSSSLSWIHSLVYNESQWLNFLQRKWPLKNPLKQRGERAWQSTYQPVQLSEWQMGRSCLSVKTVSSVLWAVASRINVRVKHLMHTFQQWHFVANSYKIVVRRRSAQPTKGEDNSPAVRPCLSSAQGLAQGNALECSLQLT